MKATETKRAGRTTSAKALTGTTLTGTTLTGTTTVGFGFGDAVTGPRKFVSLTDDDAGDDAATNEIK